jgi:hypothetical protein
MNEQPLCPDCTWNLATNVSGRCDMCEEMERANDAKRREIRTAQLWRGSLIEPTEE